MNWIARSCTLAAGALLLPVGAHAQSISLTTPGSAVAENFDTLASTGTSTFLPSGWFLLESGTNFDTTYTAGNGSGNAGDTYSFGTVASPERAFGGINSGSLVPTIGARFLNNTGSTLTSLLIAYTGEQWRLGERAASILDRLDFQYSLDATFLGDGNWTDVNALDFNAPKAPTGTAASLDGNASGNRTVISQTIAGLSIAPGDVFWIRWNSFDAAPGADDGLAIDDFSLTPFASTIGGGGGEEGGGGNGTGVPEPASLALLGIGLLGLAALRWKPVPGGRAVPAR